MKCDGYGKRLVYISRPPIRAVTTGLNHMRPLLPRKDSANLDQRDIMYFDLFRTRLVYELSGYTFLDFWSRIVLCESMTEPCVLEAILAISALSSAVSITASEINDQPAFLRSPSALHPWTTKAMVNDHHKAAVGHYIQALSIYRKRVKLSTSKLSSRLALIVSILFITFEMLQGDMKTVDNLITSSINLLKNALELYPNDAVYSPGTKCTPRIEDDLEDIEHLLPYISIMSGYTTFLTSQSNNIQLWDSSRSHGLPDPEAGHFNIIKLQTQWGKFYTSTAAFIGQRKAFICQAFASQWQTAESTADVEERQKVLIEHLNTWAKRLESWSDKISSYDKSTQRSLQVIRIQHLILLICVSCCIDPTEVVYDSREAAFSTLLARCALYLHEVPPTYGFTLSTSILSALDLIIIRCRVHDIRMMAVAIMRQFSWREGAWDSTLMLYGKLGGLLLEERWRDESGFIAPEHRWSWTGGEWNVEEKRLVARYIRAVPDKQRMPVFTELALDLENLPDICSDVGCCLDHLAESRKLSSKMSILY